MVQAVSNGGQVGMVAFTAVRYAQPDSPGIVMPVRRAQAVYANFTHIQVRPDSHLKNGVPLYKLRILDSLIDTMARKTRTGVSVEDSPGGTALRADAGSIDAVIAGMSRDLRSSGGSRSAYRAGFFPEPGAFVDLVA